jgi:adsorption protein B
MITNFLPPISVVLIFLPLVGAYDLDEFPVELQPVFSAVLWINVVALNLRLVFRIMAFKHVYGCYDVIGVLLRWSIAVAVNALAVARAWKIYFFDSALASRPIVWAKTQHEVPIDFSS